MKLFCYYSSNSTEINECLGQEQSCKMTELCSRVCRRQWGGKQGVW